MSYRLCILLTERAESPSGVGDLMRSHGTMVSRPQKPTGKKYRVDKIDCRNLGVQNVYLLSFLIGFSELLLSVPSLFKNSSEVQNC